MKAFSRTTAVAAVALASALVSTNASAVNLATDGVGQVAIAPLYTARNGWTTAINLTNVTNSPLLVKVRFHEGHNSRDVLDFNVALSAFDVFTGVIKEDVNGNPVFQNTDAPADGVGDNRDDYTCTIPNTRTLAGDAIEVPLNFLGFANTNVSNYDDSAIESNDDGGLGGNSLAIANAQAIDRLKEGYVEFIVMGHADPELADATDPVVFDAADGTFLTGYTAELGAAEAANVDAVLDGAINIARAIEQHDCANLQTALGLYNTDRALESASQFGQPINALKFTFGLINPQGGLAAAAPATTWANFYGPANGSGGDGAGNPDFNQQGGFVFPYDNFLCDIRRGDEHFSTPAASRENWCPDGSNGDLCDGVVFGAVDNAILADEESCRNLVTMQDTSEFLEPTLNDAYPQVANVWEDSLNVGVEAAPVYTNSNLAGNAIEAVRGVDALSLTIQRQRVFNQFSNNTALGARTETIITSPTKAFYVDQGDGNQFQIPNELNVLDLSNNGQGLGALAGALPRNEAFVDNVLPSFDGGYAFVDFGGAPYLPYENAFGPTTGTDRTTAQACNEVAIGLYDRAENPLAAAPPGEPPFSPAPPVEADPRDLCYEMTIVNFGPNTLGMAQNRLDVSDLVSKLATDTGNTSGWFSLVLGPDADTDGTAIGNGAYDAAFLPADVLLHAQTQFGFTAAPEQVGVSGLPVISFTLATLNFPSRPDLSFGTAAESSYNRVLLESSEAAGLAVADGEW
ncbi:MAG: hypothetical protein ACSHXK_01150 [Oceanococcus sp.]